MHTFLIIFHIIGISLGVGGATISDFLFFKTIKDGRIEKTEFDLLKVASGVIWIGFAILAFSGAGLLLFERLVPHGHESLVYSASFLAKMTIVFIIFINGLVMHWKVFPICESSLDRPLAGSEFLRKKAIAFSTGAISIVSWYSALILGAWRGLEASYGEIIGVYLLILLAALIASNIIGRLFAKRFQSHNLS